MTPAPKARTHLNTRSTKPAHKAGKRPRLLSINTFPAYAPAESGEEQRYLHLYRALSAHFDIDLVTSADFGARYEEVSHTPTLRERRYPKDEQWRVAFETLAGCDVSGDLSGLAFALAVSDPACALRKAALNLADGAAAVLHETPYSEPIFRDAAHRCEIYNPRTFALDQLLETVSGRGLGRVFQKLVRLEHSLASRARLWFASAQADGEKARLLHDVEAARSAIARTAMRRRISRRSPRRGGRQRRRTNGRAYCLSVRRGRQISRRHGSSSTSPSSSLTATSRSRAARQPDWPIRSGPRMSTSSE